VWRSLPEAEEELAEGLAAQARAAARMLKPAEEAVGAVPREAVVAEEVEAVAETAAPEEAAWFPTVQTHLRRRAEAEADQLSYPSRQPDAAVVAEEGVVAAEAERHRDLS